MDLSALIFVAVAVAWAVYLIPKALKHHDEVARSRKIEKFSHTLRVLARREPVNRREARLVITPGQPASSAVRVAESLPAPAVRRAAGARAARRRLRVVGLILAANAVVVALAGLAIVEWAWVAVPLGTLVAWLVACRLMVKRERAADAPVASLPVVVKTTQPEPGDSTEEIMAITDPEPSDRGTPEHAPDRAGEPGSWDPVPVTLPTYVTKASAPRTVRTIDLDSSGVWSSGHTAADSALAREAESAERAANIAAESTAETERSRRASGA